MLCGKPASGKSTLTSKLSRVPGTVLISEDVWLSGLYSDQMHTVADYVQYARKLRAIMGPHVGGLLQAGVSVVLDFPANTVETRKWMHGILQQTDAANKLHVLDVPDEVCLERLQARNKSGKHPFSVTEDQFRQIVRHYAPPTADEGFDIVLHRWDG
ncbi:ATP-binding protein [Sulfitobacter aestuariivivens]